MRGLTIEKRRTGARLIVAKRFSSTSLANGVTSTGSTPTPSRSTIFDSIGDDDEPLRLLLHDLLAQQRAAAAFDQPQRAFDLVRAIDGEVERRDVAEREERNVERPRLILGLLRRAGAADVAQLAARNASPRSRTNSLAVLPVPRPSAHAAANGMERFARRFDLLFLRCHRPLHSASVFRTVTSNRHW